jgi:hypothetical protein
MMQTAFTPPARLPSWVADAIESLESGILVESIAVGEVVKVRTGSRTYTLQARGGQRLLIEGHPEHCPEPVEVTVIGSTWGASLLRPHFVGCGMQLEYLHPVLGLVRTSRIRDIQRQAGRPAVAESKA